MKESALLDMVRRLTTAERRFEKIYQILFWYDNIPEGDDLRDLVWLANRLHSEIRQLKYEIDNAKMDNARADNARQPI